MRFTTMAIAVIAALGAACNQKEPPARGAGARGSGNGSANAIAGGAGSAAIGSAAVAPPAGPWTVPAIARAAKGDVDATALGPAVTAHFVERVQTGTQGGGRIVKTVLVLEGAGAAIAADETEEELAQDGAPATLAIAGTKDLVLAPLSPPRPFADSDADVPLDFKGPLLYVVHFQSTGEKRAVAIARDKDTIVVSSLVAPSDAVDVAPAWSTTGTIKLAPGATVTAASDPAATASQAAPVAAGDPLAASPLEAALAKCVPGAVYTDCVHALAAAGAKLDTPTWDSDVTQVELGLQLPFGGIGVQTRANAGGRVVLVDITAFAFVGKERRALFDWMKQQIGKRAKLGRSGDAGGVAKDCGAEGWGVGWVPPGAGEPEVELELDSPEVASPADLPENHKPEHALLEQPGDNLINVCFILPQTPGGFVAAPALSPSTLTAFIASPLFRGVAKLK